jgi:hypothetical protein
MTLEFGEAVKALEEHIEILKQNLLFLMAEHKPESMMSQKIVAIKRQLDKAVQERMKLSQIYCRRNSGVVAVPATSVYYYNNENSCH